MADWLALARQDPEWDKGHAPDSLESARLLARVSATYEGQTYYVTDRRAAGLGYGIESASAHRFALQRRWPVHTLVERWDPNGVGPLTLDGRGLAESRPANSAGQSSSLPTAPAPLPAAADQQLRNLLEEARVRDGDCAKCGQPATPDELLCSSCRVAGRVMLRGVA